MFLVCLCNSLMLSPLTPTHPHINCPSSYGDVYLARWHGCDVAVKCLNPSLFFSDGERSSQEPTGAAAGRQDLPLAQSCPVLHTACAACRSNRPCDHLS